MNSKMTVLKIHIIIIAQLDPCMRPRFVCTINKNSSNYNVEYRDGTKSKGDKIGMPCTHSTVI